MLFVFFGILDLWLKSFCHTENETKNINEILADVFIKSDEKFFVMR